MMLKKVNSCTVSYVRVLLKFNCPYDIEKAYIRLASITSVASLKYEKRNFEKVRDINIYF